MGSDQTAVGLGLTGPRGTASVFVGINPGEASYGFISFRNGAWEDVHGSTGTVAVPTGIWIPQRVVVRGSSFEYFVNDVAVAEITSNISRAQVVAWFQAYGRASIRNLMVRTKLPVAFVIMEFSPEFDPIYSEVIKPVAEAHGFRVVRADEITLTGAIMADILRSIHQSSIIIADVSPDNPNVFYELGYAHGIRKDAILLCKRDRKLPFDVSGLRTIFYDNTIAGKTAVEHSLRAHLSAIVAATTQGAPSLVSQ